MPEFTASELKSKTTEELAILGERHHPLSAEGILIADERQRRLITLPVSKKQWYEKPSGIIFLGVLASLLAAALWLFYGPR